VTHRLPFEVRRSAPAKPRIRAIWDRHVPALRRVAIMANVDYPAVVLEMRQVETAAGALGLDSVAIEIRRGEDIAPVFGALKERTFHKGSWRVMHRRVAENPAFRVARGCRTSLRRAGGAGGCPGDVVTNPGWPPIGRSDSAVWGIALTEKRSTL
jgi:hypothetical protein